MKRKAICSHYAVNLVLPILLLVNTQLIQTQTLAFPEAEGFGKYTTGGRGGEVHHVTNLYDSGEGSFRDAVSESNRIVVFDVGGVIEIDDRIVIHSNITVAGQTAPGGGITIYGNGIALNDDSGNNIIRYIRIRMGKNGDSGKDAVGISAGTDYIFDHVSISWGRDGTLDVNGSDIDNLTFQDCIISQGINNSNHSTGGLLQSGQWSVIRSLYIDNKTRNPKARGTHEFINSVLYNWGTNGYIMGDTEGTSECNLMGNYFIYGPSCSSNSHITGTTPTFYVYPSDNWVDSDADGSLDGSLLSDYKTATVQSSAFDYPGVNTLLSAQDAVEHVAEYAGASLVRDEVDELLISQLLSYGTEGAIINTEADNGIDNNVGSVANGTSPTDTDQDGMPDSWEEENGMDPSTADDSGDNDGDGYTNIEEYLNWIPNNYEASTLDAFATIEAEDFSYQSGIETEDCDEGGENVGYIHDGDWISFSNVDFGDGADSVLVRASCNSSEGTLHIRLNGNSESDTEIGSVYISSTGGWQTYADFTCDVSQVAGTHDLYLVFEGGDSYLFNLNYFYFTEVSDGNGSSITIEENETGFCGVDGSIDNDNSGFSGDGFANTDNASGNGVDYRISIGESGTYTFTFRYASSSDRPARLLLDGSTWISSIDFPSSGAWTTYTTVSTATYIESGTYDLRLEATGSSGLANIDYLQITGTAPSASNCDATKAVNGSISLNEDNENAPLVLYPNPAQDKVTLQIPNAKSTVDVSITNATGNMVFQKTFIHNMEGAFSKNLDIADLATGIYYISIHSGALSKTIKLLRK